MRQVRPNSWSYCHISRGSACPPRFYDMIELRAHPPILFIRMAQRAFNFKKNTPHNCSRQEMYCSKGSRSRDTFDQPAKSKPLKEYEDRGQAKKTNAQSYTVHLISKSSLSHPYCPHQSRCLASRLNTQGTNTKPWSSIRQIHRKALNLPWPPTTTTQPL